MTSSTRQTKSPSRATMAGEQALRPRARFLRTFGDELISSETVALIELVKNSYDADATMVLIRFTPPLKPDSGRIEVIDNGHGMSLDTIQTAWMEPATLSKVRKAHSEGLGRRVLGEKGIGRFAASRLAKGLVVITKRREARNQTVVAFDWTQYDNPDLYLDEIKIPWREEPATDFTYRGSMRTLWDPGQAPTSADLRHGTILRMDDLNSSWGEAEFRRLRSGLSRLVSPYVQQKGQNGRNLSGGFSIRLEVPEPFGSFSGPIEPPETMRSAHYTLKGSVDKDGSYIAEIALRNGEQIDFLASPGPTVQSSYNCGPFDIELRVWDRDPSSMGEIARLRASTIRDVRSDLDAMAGIAIYRDGFRVLPYGERNNDWLRLDARRVQNPPLRLSNNQIVGHVFIGSDTNPLLKDQSNREGLIEGPALEELRAKVIEFLREIEVRRFDLRAKERNERGRSGRAGVFVDFGMADVVNYIRINYPGDTEFMNLVREKSTDLDRRVEEVQEVLARYHRLATLGNLVDIVLHDGRAPMTKIAQAALMARRDIGRTNELSRTNVEKVRQRIGVVSSQISVLGALFKKIEPFGGRSRDRPVRIEIERAIKDAFEVLSSEYLRLKVKLDLPETSTNVTIRPADIQDVIVNMARNSLYWLEGVDKAKRQIKVEVTKHTPKETQFIFSDSGPGVAQEFAERIFDPYFSTRPDGIGLGLSITGGILADNYDGDIELLKSGPLPGATFRVTLRSRT